MRKINLYFLTFILLFFANPSFSIEQEIRDIVDSIDAAKNDFNDVDTKQDYFATILSTIGKDTSQIDEKLIKKICSTTYVHE